MGKEQISDSPFRNVDGFVFCQHLCKMSEIRIIVFVLVQKQDGFFHVIGNGRSRPSAFIAMREEVLAVCLVTFQHTVYVPQGASKLGGSSFFVSIGFF